MINDSEENTLNATSRNYLTKTISSLVNHNSVFCYDYEFV